MFRNVVVIAAMKWCLDYFRFVCYCWLYLFM